MTTALASGFNAVITQRVNLLVSLPVDKIRELYEHFVAAGNVERWDHPFDDQAFLALVGVARTAGCDAYGVSRFATALVNAIERGEGRIERPRRPGEADGVEYLLFVVKRAP